MGKSATAKKKEPISVALDPTLVKDIDAFVRKNPDIVNRSLFFSKASRILLSMKKCRNCGQLSAGPRCNYCGALMDYSQQEVTYARELYFSLHPEHLSTEEYMFDVSLDEDEIGTLLSGTDCGPAKRVSKIERKTFLKNAVKMMKDS